MHFNSLQHQDEAFFMKLSFDVWLSSMLKPEGQIKLAGFRPDGSCSIQVLLHNMILIAHPYSLSSLESKQTFYVA